ncbi:MAG: thiamine-phosphate kinase [Blastochloris sp.]|nr:thiamine-phosphate kinase [Blastochloris sp.]
MTEDDHINRWLKLWPNPSSDQLPLGPGDDCAVLPPGPARTLPVVKTDAVVQDVHFRLSDSPQDIGHKALARVLSDFAAMGATPRHALITLGLPKTLSPKLIDGCYRGMARLAKKHQVNLAGGETTRSRDFWISVAAFGFVKRQHLITRSGAQAGHLLLITGRLGGSSRHGSRRHLRFSPRLAEGQWLAQHRYPSAMMDLSDGLGKDLPRLATASQVSYHLRAASLPRHTSCSPEQAVNDGEDFELLFSLPESSWSRLRRAWPFSTRLSVIGHLTSLSQQPYSDGVPMRGYDHLQSS